MFFLYTKTMMHLQLNIIIIMLFVKILFNFIDDSFTISLLTIRLILQETLT